MTDEPTGVELGKKRAAQAALDLVEPGMRLGLGSGSTADWFVRLLAERVGSGLDLRCVATSERTRLLAESCGIAVEALDDVGRLDLTVDGADEVDPALDLIKGGGGCHLIEKIVAAASARMVVIADDSKLVDRLGAFPLPVEVVPGTWRTVAAAVAEAAGGVAPELRAVDGRPFRTDEGNLIVDLPMGAIEDTGALAVRLAMVPGAVEHGLFVGMAERALLGGADGSVREVTR